MQKRFGISTALLTPFEEGSEIDAKSLTAHAQHLLLRGVSSVTLFGTTGEGASVGAAERQACLEAMVSSGIAPGQIVLGIAASATEDAVAQIASAFAVGIKTFLLLPPFYFKGCSDQGLLDWHMQVIARVPEGAQIILYHIPQVTGVPLSVDLVGRIAAAAPGRVRAIKDSSGNWDNTKALLDAGAVSVLVGDERQLHKAAALGADGSICGFSNLYPERLVRLFETATEDLELTAEVTRLVAHPVVPALKVLMAAQSGKASWEALRSPLTPLDADAKAELLDAQAQMA